MWPMRRNENAAEGRDVKVVVEVNFRKLREMRQTIEMKCGAAAESFTMEEKVATHLTSTLHVQSHCYIRSPGNLKG